MTQDHPAADEAGDLVRPPQPSVNRLTTGHLLLWMAGTAIALVVFPSGLFQIKSVATSRSALLRQLAMRDNFEKAITAVVGPLFGTAVASLPLAGQHLLERRSGFPVQPGHWLLLLLGLLYLLFSLFTRLGGGA